MMALHEGSYTWEIEGDLLQQMKNAKPKQELKSPIFQMCQLNWQLEVYPNGKRDNDVGSFRLFLKLLSIPKDWKQIILSRRLQCLETGSIQTNPALSYTTGKSTDGRIVYNVIG